MIKSILEFTREEAESLGKIGFTHKAGLHHDVCTALAEGKTQREAAETYGISDVESIHWIKRHKCPECIKFKR